MKTIILSGPILTMSGYGQHCRSVAKFLLSKPNLDVKFHLTPWGNTPWAVREDAFDGLAGEVMHRSDIKEKANIAVHVKLPNEFTTELGEQNVGITAAVETDVCNPKWIDACNKMNQIIVPSMHVMQTLQRTGNVAVPLHVVPEPYSQKCAADDVEPLKCSFSAPYNFLIFGQLTATDVSCDRKNTFNTLKWLCEAFRDNENVGIAIKTNVGRNTKIDRMNTENLLRSALKTIRRKSIFPRITLLHGDMSDAEVAGLYRHPQIKAIVSLSRGEGWCLPLIDAAASGLPIIATNWSGHLDFLNKGNFMKIDYTLGNIPQQRIDENIFMKNARWAEPSEGDFKVKAKKFYEKPETPTKWAGELKNEVRRLFSQERINELYDNAFAEAGMPL